MSTYRTTYQTVTSAGALGQVDNMYIRTRGLPAGDETESWMSVVYIANVRVYYPSQCSYC